MTTQHNEVGGELLAIAVRTSPGALMSALTLNHVVAFLTACFLLVQIGYLLWKWRREWVHASRNRQMIKQAERDAEP